LLVVATATMSGCALYSETRDKQGQAAKEAWGKVDLVAPLTTTRQNQQALLEERLKLEDELWMTYREARARELLGWDVKTFHQNVDGRASDLLGPGKKLSELHDTRQKILNAQELRRIDTSGLRSVGISVPSCEVVQASKSGTAAERAEAQALINAMLEKVPAVLRNSAQNLSLDSGGQCAAATQGFGSYGGELGQAQTALSIDQNVLKASQLKAQAAQSRYELAVAEYEQALTEFSAAAAKGDDTDASRNKLDAALQKAAAVLGALERAQDAFSIKVVSQARLESLDRFLTTYSDVKAGKGSPENANRAAIALAVFPDLRTKAQAVLADLEKPNLIPLTMQKALEKAKLTGAQRDIDVINSRLALRQAHIDAVVAQAEAHYQVTRALDHPAAGRLVNATLLQALQPLTAKEMSDRGAEGPVVGKQKLWIATALYLDAEGKLKAEAVKAEHRIVALSYQQAASLAESNLAQWKALIDPSVDLMAAYGASGTRSTDITSFLNTLTLFWIGLGVH